MEFSEVLEKAKAIRKKYNVENRLEGYKVWGAQEYAQALVGDVGDVHKLLLAMRGFSFSNKNAEEKLAKELADCLWGIAAIAGEMDIDLEKEFYQVLKKLDAKVSARKVVKKPRV